MESVLDQATIKTAGPAAPVLQTIRGFRVAPLNYGAAPQVNPRGFVTGWEQVGQGMQQLGGSLGQIGQQYNYAKNVQHVADAEIAMDAATSDIHAKLASDGIRDKPDAWVPTVTQHVNQVGQALLTNKDLSPLARQQIQLRLLKWGTQLKGQTNMARITRQFDLTGQSLGVAHDQALDPSQNNFTEAAQIREQAKPYLSPAALYGMEQKELDSQRGLVDQANDTLLKSRGTAALPEIEKNVRDSKDVNGKPLFPEHVQDNKLAALSHIAKVQDLTVIANDDPRRAIELAYTHEKNGSLTGPERVQIVDAASGRLNELSANSMKSWQGKIQVGVPDKVKASDEILNDTNLSLDQKIELHRFLDQGPVNDPVAFAKLFSDAKNFTGKEGSPEHSRLLSRIDMALKDEQKGSVLSTLADTLKSPQDSQKRAIAGIYSQMADDLKDGLFGPLHGRLADNKTMLSPKDRAEVDAIKAEITTPDELARLKTEPTRADYLEGKARETWWMRNHKSPASGETWRNHVVEDSAATHAAADRAWKAMADTESFQKQHPEATPDEIKAHYDSQLVRQRGASQIGGAPTMNAMPSLNGLQGAPPPVSLLPPIEEVLKKYAPNTGK